MPQDTSIREDELDKFHVSLIGREAWNLFQCLRMSRTDAPNHEIVAVSKCLERAIEEGVLKYRAEQKERVSPAANAKVADKMLEELQREENNDGTRTKTMG